MKQSNMPLCNTKIRVGARCSPLSQAQVREVEEMLRLHYPEVALEPTWVTTTGDHDQITSLRQMDKTDFFTKEIDTLVLEGSCDVGIHAAKDLPDPLPNNLTTIALTHGVDPSDMLVLRQEEALITLQEGARIGTSSKRREHAVRKLRDNFCFVDIRGNIGQRLAQLDRGAVDGVVIAEAALIRLGLTHLNRIPLPGPTTPFQGQLAIVARTEMSSVRYLFKCIDSRV